MILLFIAGFLSGALCLLIFAILFLLNVFGKRQINDQFLAQIATSKTRIPSELKAFLRSAPDGNGSEWESCSSLTLLLHFLFQEHKDTRQFRRWMYKKLQLELNDVTARSSAAGRIIQGIQIRDLEAGTNSPMVRNVRVEGFGLAEDDPDLFEELVLLLDLDYRGGFQMSVDALMAFGKFAQLSVKLVNLSGRARLTIRRQPFAHWSFSFVENPQMELKIESQFQGRNLRHLIPLIGSAFRKVLQLKHVWPNYKLRFRPFFQNPLFNPSPNLASLEHIALAGSGLEVTVLSATRLNIFPANGAQKLFCKVMLERRPYGAVFQQQKAGEGNAAPSFREASHLLSVLLAFSRKGAQDKLGLTFGLKDGKEVRVEKIEAGSNAEKCGFRVGDCLVAVNNIPVRNERQASRLLTGTAGDLMVLVERRELDEAEEEGKGGKEAIPLLLSPSARSIDEEHFHQLPDSPPMEIKARDEPEMEMEGEEIGMRRSMSKEDSESMEMRPLVPKERRPSTLEETPRRPSKMVANANSIPKTPNGISHSPITPEIVERKAASVIGEPKRKKRKILKKIVRGGGGSFRAARIGRKGRRGEGMRRSRSESSLVRIKVPEVRIQSSEEDLAEKTTPEGLNEEKQQSEELASPKVEVEAGGVSREGIGTTEKHHSSKRAKINQMVQAGMNRWMNLTTAHPWRRKPAELAIEANDEGALGEMAPNGLGMDHLDKPKKKKTGRNKSKSPSPSIDLSEKSKSIGMPPDANKKRTKSVALTKNAIWGQSLHFGLQKDLSAYLNVLIYAEKEESHENILLGYTSIYVPRIVDDCMLTLSNCHRERFHLKGPKERENSPGQMPPDLDELSRHNGFDPRLCFGDIVLGFRFFADGLPEELKGEVGSQQEAAQSQLPSTSSAQTPSPPAIQSGHKWIGLNPKQVAALHFSCGLCGGKIWINKGGSRCDRCNLACHNKCQEMAKYQECQPNATFTFNDDGPFEELDPRELNGIGAKMGENGAKETTMGTMDKRKSATEEQIGSEVNKSGCRRRRIAEKIAGIGASWKNRRSKVEEEETKSTQGSESPESPIYPQNEQQIISEQPLIAISEVLDRQFLDSLEGFSPEAKFEELRFEPGNAYNAQVICEAKIKGQLVFGGMGSAERKAKINGQIDRVQGMIEKVTRERRSLPDKTGEEFDQIDNRLQALALVMLLYCSGLSDCVDKEEAEEIKRKQQMENLEMK